MYLKLSGKENITLEFMESKTTIMYFNESNQLIIVHVTKVVAETHTKIQFLGRHMASVMPSQLQIRIHSLIGSLQ
jgi:hypothetical protein